MALFSGGEDRVGAVEECRKRWKREEDIFAM